MSEQSQDTKPTQERRSDFVKWTAAKPPPAFGQFVASMRDVQDLAVSAAAPDDVVEEAAKRARELAELLEPYRAPEGASPAGRVMTEPGRGHLLLPPWSVEKFAEDGAAMSGEFRRFHVGGNNAVHGGVVPLLFDEVFGLAVKAAKVGFCRTAYLTTNYRAVTPIDTKLFVEAKIDRREDRKVFVSARLTDKDGTLLADADALMIAVRRD